MFVERLAEALVLLDRDLACDEAPLEDRLVLRAAVSPSCGRSPRIGHMC
jgi:hypothetical protein